MSGSTRLMVAAVATFALVAGFWFLILSPQRQKAETLSAQVDQLRTEVDQKRQEAAAGAESRASYREDYGQLVTLGKAVPGGDDTASLLAQLNGISDSSGVSFNSVELSAAVAETAPTTAPTAPGAPTATAPVPEADPAATATAAAQLPIGATVGAAGLGVLPYKLGFTGSFFHVADFIAGLDRMVSTADGKVTVDGRLVTINGFSLVTAKKGGFPNLDANFLVTTYLTPPSEGVTAGATPTTPAAVDAAPTANATP